MSLPIVRMLCVAMAVKMTNGRLVVTRFLRFPCPGTTDLRVRVQRVARETEREKKRVGVDVSYKTKMSEISLA